MSRLTRTIIRPHKPMIDKPTQRSTLDRYLRLRLAMLANGLLSSVRTTMRCVCTFQVTTDPKHAQRLYRQARRLAKPSVLREWLVRKYVPFETKPSVLIELDKANLPMSFPYVSYTYPLLARYRYALPD